MVTSAFTISRGPGFKAAEVRTVAVAHEFDLALDLAAGDETSRSALGHLLDPAAHQLVPGHSDLKQALAPVTSNLPASTTCLVVARQAFSEYEVDGILKLGHVHGD